METSSPFRVALVALPWSSASRPSAAVAALKSYITYNKPDWTVDAHYSYLDLAAQLGFERYLYISERCYDLGELFYYELYNEGRGHNYVSDILGNFSPEGLNLFEEFGANFDDIIPALKNLLSKHLDELTQMLLPYDVVALTTCFGQLFANLELARRLKIKRPKTAIILGGSSVSATIGPQILGADASIDYIIQGEGEAPFLELLNQLKDGIVETPQNAEFETSILSQSNFKQFPSGRKMREIYVMDELPYPDYEEYYSKAEQLGLRWSIPIEGSRGCWWDRTYKTKNPKNTCHFCNLNIQWNGYREKSINRIVEEVDVLTSKYANCDIFFLDNIIRAQGIEELANSLHALDKDLRIFYELRAHIKPKELLSLWKAGVTEVQIGIEALSTGLLRRMGKGTSLLQNIQVMKTCYELRIDNCSNLISHYPNASQRELDESAEAIDNIALIYQPLNISKFSLGLGSTLDILGEEFGLRPDDGFSKDENTGKHLKIGPDMMSKNYRERDNNIDWGEFKRAHDKWKTRHQNKDLYRSPLLEYQNGGEFLTIIDRRYDTKEHTLRGMARKIYLYCLEIRNYTEIKAYVGSDQNANALKGFLNLMVKNRLMITEAGKYLSLAVTAWPERAAARIERATNN